MICASYQTPSHILEGRIAGRWFLCSSGQFWCSAWGGQMTAGGAAPRWWSQNACSRRRAGCWAALWEKKPPTAYSPRGTPPPPVSRWNLQPKCCGSGSKSRWPKKARDGSGKRHNSPLAVHEGLKALRIWANTSENLLKMWSLNMFSIQPFSKRYWKSTKC